eukprot:6925948-Lingulodinium_polyedra.AAC.1
MPPRDDASSVAASEPQGGDRAACIPEHEAMDFGGAAGVARDVASAKIPCGQRAHLHGELDV